jgi:hypothetical protein
MCRKSPDPLLAAVQEAASLGFDVFRAKYKEVKLQGLVGVIPVKVSALGRPKKQKKPKVKKQPTVGNHFQAAVRQENHASAPVAPTFQAHPVMAPSLPPFSPIAGFGLPTAPSVAPGAPEVKPATQNSVYTAKIHTANPQMPTPSHFAYSPVSHHAAPQYGLFPFPMDGLIRLQENLAFKPVLATPNFVAAPDLRPIAGAQPPPPASVQPTTKPSLYAKQNIPDLSGIEDQVRSLVSGMPRATTRARFENQILKRLQKHSMLQELGFPTKEQLRLISQKLAEKLAMEGIGR